MIYLVEKTCNLYYRYAFTFLVELTKFQIISLFKNIKISLNTFQVMFCPKKCDGESKNGKPVEFGENILLEGKN